MPSADLTGAEKRAGRMPRMAKAKGAQRPQGAQDPRGVQGEDREAFARKPSTIGKVAASAPQTGEEYLASLRDGRTVYIYGERVADVTTHPAFRNPARMV